MAVLHLDTLTILCPFCPIMSLHTCFLLPLDGQRLKEQHKYQQGAWAVKPASLGLMLALQRAS